MDNYPDSVEPLYRGREYSRIVGIENVPIREYSNAFTHAHIHSKGVRRRGMTSLSSQDAGCPLTGIYTPTQQRSRRVTAGNTRGRRMLEYANVAAIQFQYIKSQKI